MIDKYEIDGIELIFGKEGRRDWGKYTFPVLYGLPVKAKWKRYEFDFNLKGNLKRICGRPPAWPNQLEQLKRTEGNNYIYYGIFGYEATYHMIHNYYVPFTGKSDPPVFNEAPFEEEHVARALKSFDEFIEHAGDIADRAQEGTPAQDFLRRIRGRNRRFLAEEAEKLHDIIGGCVPVMPPDTLEVDYEVIPLFIMDGCLYRCKFCSFKGNTMFNKRDKSDVERQIPLLKHFYGEDLVNYNSIVLGQNDALAAGKDMIEFAAMKAYTGLNIENSYHYGANLFLFGSVASLLNIDHKLFDTLNTSPYNTYINIGLESPDQETLDYLGKPIRASDIETAFDLACCVNKEYERIRMTCNFVLGRSLPAGHIESVKKLLSSAPGYSGRDTVYLSPLMNDCERDQIRDELQTIKLVSRPDVYLYLVQQL